MINEGNEIHLRVLLLDMGIAGAKRHNGFNCHCAILEPDSCMGWSAGQVALCETMSVYWSQACRVVNRVVAPHNKTRQHDPIWHVLRPGPHRVT